MTKPASANNARALSRSKPRREEALSIQDLDKYVDDRNSRDSLPLEGRVREGGVPSEITLQVK
jgi:hypothetical protein